MKKSLFFGLLCSIMFAVFIPIAVSAQPSSILDPRKFHIRIVENGVVLEEYDTCLTLDDWKHVIYPELKDQYPNAFILGVPQGPCPRPPQSGGGGNTGGGPGGFPPLHPKS